jgi:hypothetical protein
MARILPIICALAMLASAGAAQARACGWRAGAVLTEEGTANVGGLDGRLLRRVEMGSGRLYRRIDIGWVASVADGYDGRVAWSQDSSGGTHDRDSGFARALAISEAWLDGRAGCAPKPSREATPLGERTEGGRRFEVWRITPAGGAAFEVWYDAGTGRPDRAHFQTTETRLIRHFDDWREVAPGRWVAFASRDEFPEDQAQHVFRITKVQIAPRAKAADFRRPAAPHDVRMLGGRVETVVPYEDDHRTRVFVPVYLNGKGPFAFELDNGGHFILNPETAKAAGVAVLDASATPGPGNEGSGFAHVPSFRIGDAEVRGLTAEVFDLGANDRGPALPRAGIIGIELFERFRVRIDARAKTVTLRPLGRHAPEPRGTPLRLVFAEDAPLVAGSYSGVAGDFMLDAGNAGATIIEDFWAQAHGVTGRLKRGFLLSQVRYSRGDVGIGGFALPGEVVSYYGPVARGSEYTRAVAGIYGEPLLSRFTATYDYRRHTVWLEPLPDMVPIPPSRAGMMVARETPAAPLRVTDVTANSPAAEAGLKAGDTLLSVGGRPAASLSRADVLALMRQSAGTVVEIATGDPSAPRQRRLTLRDLTMD